MTARVAAAVAIPALQAVRTAPSAAFPNFGFEHRRMVFQIFAVVCKLCQVVRCDVDELRPGSTLIGECRHQSRGQSFSAGEEVFEGNRSRDWSIIEEDRDF